MAEVAKAYVTVVPKFTGFKAAVESELNSTTSSAKSAGSKFGSAFSSGASGLVKSGALVGVFSSITSSALNSITSHLGDAISRFDTLNNYPTVMQSLGYSAEDAEASINLMSDRLQTLPTTLDDMVSTVKGISAVTGDLDQATYAGLALNDMLLASGSSTQLTTAAMEQFRQMLSKGKPDMQDWKSLVQAAPGQMNQLAEAMLGAGATANDLYTALGGGGAEATITMDELLNAMIRLDTEGGEGFASFKDQAETAAGGVSTSMANMQNAITRGITGVMDEIGKDTIAGVFDDMKGAINTAFSGIKSAVATFKPVMTGLYDVFKQAAPAIAGATTGLVGFMAVVKTVSMVQTLTAALGPVSLAFTAISAAAAVVVPLVSDYSKKQENAAKATTSLKDAMDGAANMEDYRSSLDGVGSTSGSSAQSLDDLRQSIVDTADTIAERNEEAEQHIGLLNTAMDYIDRYSGQTDLSTKAQGRLQWAIQQVNDEFGTTISMEDAVNGTYQSEEGAVSNLKDKVHELIEAKRQEIKINALQDDYTDLLNQQTEAQKTYAAAVSEYNKQYQAEKQRLIDSNYAAGDSARIEAEANRVASEATEAMGKSVSQSKDALDTVNSALQQTEDYLGIMSNTTDDTAKSWSDFATNLDAGVVDILGGSDKVAPFIENLQELGVTTEQLAGLTAEQMYLVADSYEGTADSAATALMSVSDDFDFLANKTGASTASIIDCLEDIGFSADNLNGKTLDDFSQALSDAGVSTKTLNQLGTDNLNALAETCNGDMDLMVNAIQVLNSTELMDKDGNINVNDVKLLDAQGNVYTYNETGLYDKNGIAAVDGTQVQDATGKIYTYNATDLTFKRSNAIVDGNAVTGDATTQVRRANASIQALSSKDVSVNANGNASNGSAASAIWDTVNAIRALSPKNIINTVTNVVSTITGNAAGGIRPHADGGIIPRYHAGGAIATKAVPLDIVGEAGAEAIVPLTNERYSKPFASLIARLVKEALNTPSNITVSLDSTSQAQGAPIININGAVLNDDAAMQTAALNFMNELGRMNRLNKAGA